MSRIRRTALVAALMFFITPCLASAAKTTYIATDHRFNYVKLKEVPAKVAAKREMTHPSQVDEQGLRAALGSVQLSHSYLVKKEVDTQQVFDEAAIDFLANNLSKAFSQAGPNEEVVFSYLSKKPILILRNDRLNLGRAWLHNYELHMSFDKLYAKVTGDIDKRGNEGKAISRATGLRIKLELGPGQMMAMDNPNELVLNMHYNYAESQRPEVVQQEERTMAGEVMVPAASQVPPAAASAPKDAKYSKNGKASKAMPEAAAVSEGMATSTAGGTNAADRLRDLDDLRKQGLINSKEYKDKRKEILGDL